MLEFDLRFPDVVQVDVGMLGLGLSVETEESPWQGRVAHGLLGCGGDVERPGLVFETRLLRSVEIRLAEGWRRGGQERWIVQQRRMNVLHLS